MKVGFVGLGKLGLPVAITIAYKGHQVIGYDVNPQRFTTELDTVEAGLDGNSLNSNYSELFDINPETQNNISFTPSLENVLVNSDIVFVAVQTPHNPRFEGCTRLPEERVDFDYTWLVDCMKNISETLDRLNLDRTVIIISTVLPGTIRRCIFPVLSSHVNLCYNPYFIAMGTVVRDFLEPEFILLGCVSDEATDHVIEFYKTISNSQVYRTNLENAEMIKVSYNTFITTKICLANNIMEMCDKLPNTDCDKVMEGLFLGTRRIISTNYLRGGGPDSGSCHPRDNIALSHLSRKINVNFDFFTSIMTCREKQTEYLAILVEEYHNKHPELPVYIFGKAFKPHTRICAGSGAVLIANMLSEKDIDITEHYDPYVSDGEPPLTEKGIYLIATQHNEFKEYVFPDDSIVIDIFRYLKVGKNGNINLHSVGICDKN